MLKVKNKIDLTLLLLNIFFLFYYSIQLLVFTDEFAINNLGFFNHAIAGLSEIIGIIFFSLAIGLIIVLFSGTKNQYPLLIIIFVMNTLICLNFWRYIFTNSPGQTDIISITYNAVVFSIISLTMLTIILRIKKS